ncbi:hypothetical protein DFH07DRAFT_936050 [Mycena maculata]|uniref:Uncharacterized protein n=1 Tax=Mycena maculata TaxID=230809 RepID=A0AAD7NYD1_9AGAR|nr:hypothetical protein DFH07DRAFT_936050 [Mycena maculata]
MPNGAGGSELDTQSLAFKADEQAWEGAGRQVDIAGTCWHDDGAAGCPGIIRGIKPSKPSTTNFGFLSSRMSENIGFLRPKFKNVPDNPLVELPGAWYPPWRDSGRKPGSTKKRGRPPFALALAFSQGIVPGETFEELARLHQHDRKPEPRQAQATQKKSEDHCSLHHSAALREMCQQNFVSRERSTFIPCWALVKSAGMIYTGHGDFKGKT